MIGKIATVLISACLLTIPAMKTAEAQFDCN